MSTSTQQPPVASPAPSPKVKARWFTPVLGLLAILFAGFQLGMLIWNPNRRVIESGAALLLLYLAFRLSIYQSLAFILVVFPYPTFTSAGSTNTLMVLLIAVIWAMRIATGDLKIRFDSLLTPLLPVIALAYLVSTYGIHTDEEFTGGIKVLTDVLACMALYFMVVNFVTDEKALRRTMYFLGISTVLIHLVAVYEVLFPGRAFLGGWIIAERSLFEGAKFGVRTGGPFRDFELLSEYCAVTTPIFAYLWIRAGKGARLLWTVVLCLTVFSLFASVTRGGFLSLGTGLVYLFWLLRRELGAVKSVVWLGGIAAGMAVVGVVLPQVFRMESLFSRLSQTQLKNGIPDSRVDPWTGAFNRALEHPFLGHGPYYTFGSGLVKYSWPHNGYLFLWVTIGLLGVIGYVATFLTCLIATGRARGKFLSGPFMPGFLGALHISWLVFMVDQVKIDFERNPIYFLFIWILLGLTSAAYRIAREPVLAPVMVEHAPLPPVPGLRPVMPLPGTGRVRRIMDP